MHLRFHKKKSASCLFMLSSSETCEKPPVQGNVQCMAYIPRWTYNSTDRNCVEFIWGGCAKTDNNFATETLCRTTCAEYPNIKDGHTETTTQRQPNPVISPRESENICDLPSESGMCLALFEKYYFNKIHNRCEKFNYGTEFICYRLLCRFNLFINRSVKASLIFFVFKRRLRRK